MIDAQSSDGATLSLYTLGNWYYWLVFCASDAYLSALSDGPRKIQ